MSREPPRFPDHGKVSARPDITAIASAIGEPARGKMLNALMDGRSLTATELALAAGVTPSTASSHLAQLRRAGLIIVTPQGRHRYFRIARSSIAILLERLMGIAASSAKVHSGPRDETLRQARVCYDHLAGERGVRLLDRMLERRLLQGDSGSLGLTSNGETWLVELRIDLEELRRKRRPMIRACLDWSERRDHLAGAVGAAILARLFELRLAKRDSISRALSISTRGEAFLATLEIPR